MDSFVRFSVFLGMLLLWVLILVRFYFAGFYLLSAVVSVLIVYGGWFVFFFSSRRLHT